MKLSVSFSLTGTLLFSAFLSALSVLSVARAAPLSPNDYAMTSKLLSAPAHLEVNTAGVSEFDKKAWTLEKQSDGTELYTLKSKAEPTARGAILRNADGELESMTVFKSDSRETEEAGALIFQKGVLLAYTSCENRGEKEIGRVCVTATPDLCHALKANSVRPDDLKQTDEFEMRSLAVLLTLRGSDHQLDNMAKTGNRLGLRSALQTTKGQLFASARKDKLAQTVLARTLPRLKQACHDTHF